VALSAINRALNRIPKRADQRHADQLRHTFVDSGVFDVLEVIDQQVVYGRRGTGKTHALRYLETEVNTRGDIAVYADLRTVGSPEGLFLGEAAPPTERAGRLLVDLLTQVHDSLLAAVIDDEKLIGDNALVKKLDDLVVALTSIRVAGEVEQSKEGEQSKSEKDATGVKATLSPRPGLEAHLAKENMTGRRELVRETRRGTERISLNFTDVARALREVATALTSRRVWLLLDEWSSVPPDVQPYLGEFLVRCVFPLQMFTVKIAAIQQQTRFRVQLPSGETIGIEVGADATANVDLDDFMVYEQNEERSRAFFRGLLFKHLTSGVEQDESIEGLDREADLISLGFTDKRALDELVRAAEGVPRDAINIAAVAALRAGEDRISVPDVQAAAQKWFQNDKEEPLRGRPELFRLLHWVIDEVIRGKRARGFLVNQKAAAAPLLLALYEARVLHIVRRGYSAQDQPGERYDVWVVDYGAYVDLLQTKSRPLGLLPSGDEDQGVYVDVPTQDLRAIRRAILDLDAFTLQDPARLPLS
jgi:hypothetical protein